MSRRIAASLSTVGLFAVLSLLLGGCAIQGPPDGFFDEGEGGYSASWEGDEGGHAVVGDPTSTSGISEENRADWDDGGEDDEDEGSFAEGLADGDAPPY